MKTKISDGFEIVEDLIKLRWVPEILESINSGNRRYSEIRRSIDGISHTELNRKLIILIRKKAISKQEDSENIYYSLLSFGKELAHIFDHLEKLQEKYFGYLNQ
nr:winged helix-turn-helix transcriptional regulator [Tissierella sp.]